MGLLNPLLLLLGGAITVPLLLHLFQRHQGPRVPFPALRYLLRAEKESARRIRLRQILLMMLRIAAVLLLAFAAARPFLPLGGAGHSPTAVVIVLDNSMSTGAVTGEERVIDQLKARALESLAAAGPDDRFWLLRAGSGEPALPGSAEDIAVRVRETEPSSGRADLTAALVHAQGILASGADGRAVEIHLLTDLQANAFGTTATGDGAPVIIWHPAGAPPDNRAVTSFSVGGGLAPVAGQRSTAAASVAGSGGDSVTIRVHMDGRLVAAGVAPPGSAALLALPARSAGLATGWAEIDADALRADDVRYWSGRVLPPPTVRVNVTAPFVSSALEVLAESGRVRTDGAASIVITTEPAGVPSTATAVVLPPETPASLAAANRALATAGIPWRYDPPPGGETGFAEGNDAGLSRALAGARVAQSYPLVSMDAQPGDTVLLRLDDGAAWAVRGRRRTGGYYVLFGSPLTPEATTVPTSAAMLPLMDRLTSAWALDSPPENETVPGDEVSLPSGASAVIRPDGTRDTAAAGSRYRFGGEPGVYTVMAGDSVLAAWAVNPPAAESDLARLEHDAVRELLPGRDIHISDDASAFRGDIFRERIGREIWRPLLVAALLVLLIEILVAAAGAGARPGLSRAGTRVASVETP